MSKLNIVFMGTPEFATTILKHLHESDVSIKAVVTAPDKPAGRGRKINQSDVKKYASEVGLKVLQPTNLKSDEFLNELKNLNADLFVVVAFRMLPEEVWSMPPKGTINLHASLLPNYRGAAPINWAVMNGETKTGVSTFFIEKEIDTGDIILQEEVSIGENETVGELYYRLMYLGANVVKKTLEHIEVGSFEKLPQQDFDLSQIKPAPKLFKSNTQIDFNRPVKEVHNFCRGLSPYPSAWCTLYNIEKNEAKTYKIIETRTTNISINDSNTLIHDNNGLLIPCSDYYLRVLQIQPEGKRKMDFKSFLAGNPSKNLALKAN